jgi:hypothetical protein
MHVPKGARVRNEEYKYEDISGEIRKLPVLEHFHFHIQSERVTRDLFLRVRNNDPFRTVKLSPVAVGFFQRPGKFEKKLQSELSD